MDVIALRNEGVALGLNLTKEYLEANYKILLDICNGIGAEWMGEEVLELITDYFEYFLPSTNQHDFDYDQLDKTEFNFIVANERLYCNMKIQIKKDRNLSWWRCCKKRSRWRKRLQARFLYKACVLGGKKAFFK
jgi:hypothetical protein